VSRIHHALRDSKRNGVWGVFPHDPLKVPPVPLLDQYPLTLEPVIGELALF